MLLSNLTSSVPLTTTLSLLLIPVLPLLPNPKASPPQLQTYYLPSSRSASSIPPPNLPLPTEEVTVEYLPPLGLLVEAFVQGAAAEQKAKDGGDDKAGARKGDCHFLATVISNLSVVCRSFHLGESHVHFNGILMTLFLVSSSFPLSANPFSRLPSRSLGILSRSFLLFRTRFSPSRSSASFSSSLSTPTLFAAEESLARSSEVALPVEVYPEFRSPPLHHLYIIRHIALSAQTHPLLLASEETSLAVPHLHENKLPALPTPAYVRGVDVLPKILGPLMGGEEVDIDVRGLSHNFPMVYMVLTFL